MKVRALIADDEPLARERLRHLLSSDPDVEIVGECRNGTEVADSLRAKPGVELIDVLFLDIQMPGRNTFETMEQAHRSHSGAKHFPLTVFVTAHNHYAIRAFEMNALDYLTKPVETKRFCSTLARVKERIASNHAFQNQERLLEVLSELRSARSPGELTDRSQSEFAASASYAGMVRDYPKRLLIPSGQKDVMVNVHEIEWIEAADYYACLHVGGKTLMLRESVKQLAATLPPHQFVRIHRSIIVNMDYVREIVRDGAGEGAVILTGGQRLRMSKAGWQNLLSASRTPSRQEG